MRLTHRTEFRGAAKQLLSYRGAEVVLSGPAGTGKSRACLTKIHLACLKTPGVRALVVRKTARSLGSTTLVTWREKVAKEALEAGSCSYHGGSAEHAAGYRYDNGSVVVVGGLDVPDKVLSSEYDLIFVDECTEVTEKDWNTLITRLRNHRISFQQIIGACNPGPPTHWILTRSQSSLKLLHSRHEDNPAYYSNGSLTEEGRRYMEILDGLSGVERERLMHGRWAASEGIVFTEYDPAVHLVPRYEIPDDWERVITVDFGYRHPFVAQWWAIDHDGRAVMYREIYHTERLVEDHARQMREYMRGERVSEIICDHQAESRAVLERYLGRRTRAAKKSVLDGLEAVQSRLKKRELFFMEDSLVELDPSQREAGKPTRTVDEFGTYVWDTRKEAPVKTNDDGMDCVRYLCAHLDLNDRQGVRSIVGLGI